ncbi:tail fiber assembly protein [Serratia rubidaea]|nr:tail fiber assembly protein [Serratia rubidaea]
MNTGYYFSPGLKLFFPISLEELYKKSGSLPDDIIKIDAKTFEEFAPINKPIGKELGCDAFGKPCWVMESPPTSAQSKLWAEWNKEKLTTQAESIIALIERAHRLGIATDDEKKRLTAWETYSVLLSRVDVNAAPDIEWPHAPDA